MTQHVPKSWIVAYDIREPRRLRRVHRYLKKVGASAQYSVFALEAKDLAMDRIISDIDAIIAVVDDVRAYHVPERCEVWTLGAQSLPEGVYLDAQAVARLIGSVIERRGEPAPQDDGSKVGR